MITLVRALAVVLQLGLQVFTVCAIAEHGLPRTCDDSFWFMVLVVVAPLPTLVVLLRDGGREPCTLFGLWIRRKMTEERTRLREAERQDRISGQ